MAHASPATIAVAPARSSPRLRQSQAHQRPKCKTAALRRFSTYGSLISGAVLNNWPVKAVDRRPWCSWVSVKTVILPLIRTVIEFVPASRSQPHGRLRDCRLFGIKRRSATTVFFEACAEVAAIYRKCSVKLRNEIL